MTDEIQEQLHRAIAYEKAAEGLIDSPFLSPLLADASAQIRTSVIEQGVSPEEWEKRKEDVLWQSQQQRNALASSDTEPAEAEIPEWALSSLAGIYGARVGWKKRIGEMPDLEARHPGKMLAFLDVQRKIGDNAAALSERAERLYQGLAEQGVEADEDFARVVQTQYDQFHITAATDIEDAPLDLLTALDSAVDSVLGATHAEVIDVQADPLVRRSADAVLDWLYHIESNRYESDTNTFNWNPETQQLTIEGDVSLNVQRHGEQWHDLGSEVDEPFVQRLESHLQAQSRHKPSKAGQSR